jgi:glucose-1-phosphate cytidylyltransferase
MGIKAMKVILLAGGFGSRLSEYTDTIPKPMVPIGGRPILWHIMNTYANFGHKEFYIALGYKAEVIKEYFLNYRAVNSDFTVDLSSGAVYPHQLDSVDWKVTLVDTGDKTMTGGRVKRMQPFINDTPFLLSYGDGVADIDIDDLIRFHKAHGKMVTITAVRPAARFGELELEQNRVLSFKEKPQLHDGWINGGFFVIEPEFFHLIKDDSSMIEREPLSRAVELGELMAYRHHGFWHCMDSKRDHELLEAMWSQGSAPWRI